MILSCISYYNHPFGGSQIVFGSVQNTVASGFAFLPVSIRFFVHSRNACSMKCFSQPRLKKKYSKSLETDRKACFPEIQNPKLLHHFAPKSCNICEVLGFNKALVNRETARGLSPRPRKLQAVEPEYKKCPVGFFQLEILVAKVKLKNLSCKRKTTRYVGVSKNRGTPKWMVYDGKPYSNG